MSTPTGEKRARTDRNNNPTAMTTQVAQEAGLKEGVDYVQGDSFGTEPHVYYTAKLIGNPITQTIRVINKLGFHVGTDPYRPRWTYINIPFDLWKSFSVAQQIQTIHFMYRCEGGTELAGLFSLPPGDVITTNAPEKHDA
jgi:hypothetical protein